MLEVTEQKLKSHALEHGYGGALTAAHVGGFFFVNLTDVEEVERAIKECKNDGIPSCWCIRRC